MYPSFSFEIWIEHIYNFQKILYSFVFTNSVDPDEMQHNAAFHQGRHCL